MIERMLLASKLNVDFYEMVEADTSYNREAFLVVLVASVMAAVGAMFAYGDGVAKLLTGIAATFFSWIAWSGITLWIGTHFTKGPETESDMGEMLRVLGYAHSPQVLVFFVFVPLAGPLIALTAALWSLVAGVVAIRQALDFDTMRALITVLIGWVGIGILRLVLVLVF